MKILAQNYRRGELLMLEVPNPSVRKGTLVVQTIASLVSIGTEKAMIDVAKKSLIGNPGLPVKTGNQFLINNSSLLSQA